VHATHVFLKLVQPVPTARLVAINNIPAGEERTVPFTFVVPGGALPTVCRHHVNSNAVREAHLQLPPSMGAEVPADSEGSLGTKIDDMTPPALKIIYFIRVRLLDRLPSTDSRRAPTKSVAEDLRIIRIIPAIAEQPPVNIQGQEEDYTLRKVKAVKKGMFKTASTGQLILESSQPGPLRLPAPDLQSSNLSSQGVINSTATVTLRFDPTDAKGQPPRLGNLISKLKVLTFYQSNPSEDWPKRADMSSDFRRQIQVETVNLSSRTMASAQWQRQEPSSNMSSPSSPELLRTVTTAQPTTVPAPSEEHNPANPFYLAHLLIPITLPPGKHFVPTFHSCLVSRVYILELAQEFKSSSSNTISQSSTLRVPIQILSEPREGTNAVEIPAYGDPDENEEDVDDYFTPRTRGPPPPAFTTTSNSTFGQSSGLGAASSGDQLPPEYSASPPPMSRGARGSMTRRLSPPYGMGLNGEAVSPRGLSPPYSPRTGTACG
jgi:hypothetical protein